MSHQPKDSNINTPASITPTRPGRVLVPVIALIAVAAAATLITLVILGVARDGLPTAGNQTVRTTNNASQAQAAPTLAAGQVLAPVPVEAITAFTALRDEHFVRINPDNSLALSQRAITASAKPDVITDPRLLIGRVLKFDKSAGYPIGESDLLPVGTRPGIVAGVPMGKRAMIVDADRIAGARALNRGDRFDLIAALTPETKRRVLGAPRRSQAPAPTQGITELPATDAAALAPAELEQAATELLLIADNGAVIKAVSIRDVPRGTRTASGIPAQTEVRQEFTIAVSPEEVVRLTRALAEGAEIILVARTGLPGETPDLAGSIVIPDLDAERNANPPPAPRTVETLRGTDREVVVIPPSTKAD